jgi:hypothetical protein
MMNFFNSITRLRVVAVVFAAIGIFMTVGSILEMQAQAQPREDIFALADFEFEKRQYINGYVDVVFENYAETTEEDRTFGIKTSERTYSQHYLIPCWDKNGDIRIISAEVSYAQYIEVFNEIYNMNFSENEADYQSLYFEFTGRVEEIDSDLVQYAYDSLIYSEYVKDRAEFDEYFLPYSINVLAPNAYNTTFMIIIGGVTFIFGVVVFIVDLLVRKRKAAKAAAEAWNEED